MNTDPLRFALRDLDPQNTVLLAGAGISVDYPAGFPVGAQILRTIAEWLGDGNEEQTQRALDAIYRRGSHPYDFVRFEQLWQTLELLMENVSRTMESLQTFGAPNTNHFACAEILQAGGSVFTTNFDTHVENACQQLGHTVEPWIFNLEKRPPSNDTEYFKLHGSFEAEGDLLSSLFSIGAAGLEFEKIPRVKTVLKSRTEDRTLIIAGYSFSDHFDIVPLIEHNWEPRTIIWISYDAECSDPHFEEILSSESLCLPDLDNTFELASLSRLKHKRPETRIFKARCASVSTTLHALGLFSGDAPQQTVHDGDLHALNTASFEVTLDEAGWTPPMKALAIQLLEKRDGFGFHAALDMSVDNEWAQLELPEGFEDPDLEMDDPGDDIYIRVADLIRSEGTETARNYFNSFERTKELDESHAYWISLALIEREDGNIRRAYELQIKSFNHAPEDGLSEYRSLEDVEILAGVDLDYFEQAMRVKDLEFASTLIDNLDRRFEVSGALWMAIEVANARGQMIREKVPAKGSSLFAEGRRLAEKAAYFSWRSGRWDAAKTAANELSWYMSVSGENQESVELLRRTRAVCPKSDMLGYIALTANIALNEALYLSTERAELEIRDLEARLDPDRLDLSLHVLVCRSACAFASGDHEAGCKYHTEAHRILAELGQDGWGHHVPLDAIALRFMS